MARPPVSAPILVTGGGGWIGGRVVVALRDAGHEVRALVHRADVEGASERARGDLRDPASLRLAARGARAVVHCAAALDPVESEAEADAINHRGTVALADAAEAAGCETFVFVSSQAAIGWASDAGLVREDAPCAPSTAYGRSKRAAEEALLARRGATRIVLLRPPTVYGPGERRNFLALARPASTGLFPVPGRGDNRMSFCHLDNLVDAIRFALEREAPRGVLHVADAHPVTLRETVDAIARAAGRVPIPLPFPMPVARVTARAFEAALRRPPLSRARLHTLTSDCALDVSALRRLGFRWPVGFEEGVRETVASFRAEGVL